MTSFDRFERKIPELMTELAPEQVPDYLDDMLRLTAGSRQRPAWSALERWLPMGAIARPLPRPPMSWRPIAVLAIIGLLVAAGLIAFVGSRPRVPLPFGPAANGALYFSDGDIYRMESLTATPRAIVTGPGIDEGPVPSRDGMLIAFTRRDGSLHQVYVADQDGTDVRPLVGSYASFSKFAWSHNGAELAVLSVVDGANTLSLLKTDGSGARTLDLLVEPNDFWYRPNGQIVVRGRQSETVGWSYGMWVVNADDAKARPVGPPPSGEGDWTGVSLSPDGSSIVYRVWREPDEHGRLYVVDVDTGASRPIEIAGTTSDQPYTGVQFSPDGTKILFVRHWSCCQSLSVAAVAGGYSMDIGEPVPANVDHWTPMAFFSPDGQSVVVAGDDGSLWLLDPTGARAGQNFTIPETVSYAGSLSWQRLAP